MIFKFLVLFFLTILEERLGDLEDGGAGSGDPHAHARMLSPLVGVGEVLPQDAVLGLGVGVVATDDGRDALQWLHFRAELKTDGNRQIADLEDIGGG